MGAIANLFGYLLNFLYNIFNCNYSFFGNFKNYINTCNYITTKINQEKRKNAGKNERNTEKV